MSLRHPSPFTDRPSPAHHHYPPPKKKYIFQHRRLGGLGARPGPAVIHTDWLSRSLLLYPSLHMTSGCQLAFWALNQPPMGRSKQLDALLHLGQDGLVWLLFRRPREFRHQPAEARLAQVLDALPHPEEEVQPHAHLGGSPARRQRGRGRVTLGVTGWGRNEEICLLLVPRAVGTSSH